jgi:succinate---hydroxymethylglutarate CoA-transferase
LYARQYTGHGQQVDVSLMESQLAGLVNIASSSLNAPDGAMPPKRWGTAHESIVPYQAFACKASSQEFATKEFLMVGAGNDRQFIQLCAILGIPDVAQDERYGSNASRVEHRHSLIPLLERIFLTKTRDEWVSLLEGKGFPFGPLRTVPEAFHCPQAVHRGMIQEMQHPYVGKIRLPRTPISFTDDISGNEWRNDMDDGMNNGKLTMAEEPLPPPMLGEHTAEFLTEILGMDRDSIDELHDSGVIECWDADDR